MKIILIIQLLLIVVFASVSPLSPLGKYFYFNSELGDADSYILSYNEDAVNVYVQDGGIRVSSVIKNPVNLSYVKYDAERSKLMAYHKFENVLTTYVDTDNDGFFDTKVVAGADKTEVFELGKLEWILKESKQRR